MVRKTVPNQTTHDRARSKPEVIDEAGTKGAEVQAGPPLHHTQVWLQASVKESRTRFEIQRRRGNQNQRRIRSRQTNCVVPRRREEKRAKLFPRKSRKERNKCKKAENGNTKSPPT